MNLHASGQVCTFRVLKFDLQLNSSIVIHIHLQFGCSSLIQCSRNANTTCKANTANSANTIRIHGLDANTRRSAILITSVCMQISINLARNCCPRLLVIRWLVVGAPSGSLRPRRHVGRPINAAHHSASQCCKSNQRCCCCGSRRVYTPSRSHESSARAKNGAQVRNAELGLRNRREQRDVIDRSINRLIHLSVQFELASR